jgi:hypothetical protein
MSCLGQISSSVLAHVTASEVPWPITGNWLLGLIGVLSVAYLILGVAQQSRRLFGKHPPLADELVRIDHDLRRELARATQDCERRHALLHSEFEERLRELALERVRSLSELHQKINGVAEDVAFIRGKLANEDSPNR